MELCCRMRLFYYLSSRFLFQRATNQSRDSSQAKGGVLLTVDCGMGQKATRCENTRPRANTASSQNNGGQKKARTRSNTSKPSKVDVPREPDAEAPTRPPATELDTAPFECCVCLNLYNDEFNIPTTFPCGHSVCLVHVPELSRCPVCRASIPVAGECKPTIALRDAAVIFAKYAAEQAGNVDDSFVILDHDSVRRIVKEAADQARAMRGASTRSLEDPRATQQQPPAAAVGQGASAPTQPAVAPRVESEQIAEDEMFARQLQEQLNREISQEQYQRRQPPPFTALVRQSSSVPEPAISCQRCGRGCMLRSTGTCCYCSDSRPMRPQGTYPIYIDGRGWVQEGNRNAGYCPLCRRV